MKQSYFIRTNKIRDIVFEFPKNIKILELGCGSGMLAKELRNNGYNVEITDIENRTDDLNVKLVDISFEKLPYKDNQFDMIIAIGVFEHLENQFLAFREVRRVLKQGGTFLYSVPHSLSLRSRYHFLKNGNLVGFIRMNSHISLLSKNVFKKIVLKYFRIKHIYYSCCWFRIFGKKIKINYFKKQFGNLILYIFINK